MTGVNNEDVERCGKDQVLITKVWEREVLIGQV